MSGLGENIGRIAALKAAMAPAMALREGADRLTDFSGFGSNPGALRGRRFVPQGLAPGAPLVVVLHGCTQTAAAYDSGAGWSALAEDAGFALLFPEQTRANNANLCFNWFVPGDTRRGEGEAESIRQMIAAMIANHRLDPRRVFITGLSAGGAMAMSMLALHPELFAAGAIIAGVPHGIANSVPEAFERMRGQGLPAPATLAAQVRAETGDKIRWPRLSVWHGSADMTVDPANGTAIAESWALLHGAAPIGDDRLSGQRRRQWRDARGSTVVEAITVAGMGHGTPLATTGRDALGEVQPHMLEAGISSTRAIAAFWGLAPGLSAPTAAATKAAPAAFLTPAANGVEAIIGRALRQAGLLR